METPRWSVRAGPGLDLRALRQRLDRAGATDTARCGNAGRLWLQVSIISPAFRALNLGEPSNAHRSIRNVTVVDAATVRAVAQDVNDLPVAEPAGPAPGCPLSGLVNTSGAPRYRLTFRSAAGASVLVQVSGRSGFVCATAISTWRMSLMRLGSECSAAEDHSRGCCGGVLSLVGCWA